MKELYSNVIILFAVLVLFACQEDAVQPDTFHQDADEGVMVRFINKTGHNLSGLIIADKSIGFLAKNQETPFFQFDSFHFDTGMPDEPIEAYIFGKKMSGFNIFYWCGTQKYAVTEGKYSMQITMVKSGDEKYLNLCVE